MNKKSDATLQSEEISRERRKGSEPLSDSVPSSANAASTSGGGPTIVPNDHSDRAKGHMPDTWLNDEEAVRKDHDMPDDPKRPVVDPEHDYSDPSGKRD